MSDATPEERPPSPFLMIGDTPIYFQQDWTAGIGGGLWSTGLAMCKYLGTQHAAQAALVGGNNHSNNNNPHITRNTHTKRRPWRVLELGSGNGLLSVCWAALLGDALEQLVITDLDQAHLNLIHRTLDANQHVWKQCSSVHVLKHRWGEFSSDKDSCNDDDGNPNADISTEEIKRRSLLKELRPNVIVGSDVAYREDLYDPLIASLQYFAAADAENINPVIILLGITMADTKPVFFELLERAGFKYTKLSDHLLDPEFRGTTFGIFVVQQKNNKSTRTK